MQKASAGLTPEPTTTAVSIESQIIMEATGMVWVVSFFSGVKMIYSEISMIVEFLCYHRGRAMERGYTKKKMDK